VKPTVTTHREKGRPWGAEQFDPCGVGRVEGGAPSVGGGHKKPLPTATQVEPLRGWDGERDKRKARGHGVIPLCGTQPIKPPTCGRRLTSESIEVPLHSARPGRGEVLRGEHREPGATAFRTRTLPFSLPPEARTRGDWSIMSPTRILRQRGSASTRSRVEVARTDRRLDRPRSD